MNGRAVLLLRHFERRPRTQVRFNVVDGGGCHGRATGVSIGHTARRQCRHRQRDDDKDRPHYTASPTRPAVNGVTTVFPWSPHSLVSTTVVSAPVNDPSGRGVKPSVTVVQDSPATDPLS